MTQHFKLLLPDQGRDIYAPRKSQTWGYRYGPTLMVEDGVCHAWFASPGDAFEADWFTYRKSTDGGNTWTEERVVMAPTADSMDWFSVCDPAVIKYGDYYYIGYTSTVFANGGGVCNNGFIGRSKSPTGPFERWTGDGWGEHRKTAHGECHWLGKPAPVIYFDEDWHNWGAGEFSFVIKDETIYIYYTWTSRTIDGKGFSQTRVATADITDENWPGKIVLRGVAVDRPSGGNDSYDVVFCEDNQKFIALSTDRRFSEDSMLAVYESDDGLRFTRVNEIKVNTGWMCHNCGISGDPQHHIKKGDTMLLAYAYGNKWGFWGTRLHKYDFELMEEDFYSEAHLQNVHRSPEPMEDPAEYTPTMIYCGKPHFLRVKKGDTVTIPMKTGNVAYAMRPVTEGVDFTNYDKSIVSIEDMNLTALEVGYTYVTASFADVRTEFPVYVTEEEPAPWCYMQPYPDKKVVSFEPIWTDYKVSLSARELKQLRGIATYEDGSWFELAGVVDKVSFENHNPELFRMRADGHVEPTGKIGQGTVTLICGGHAFDVTVTVVE